MKRQESMSALHNDPRSDVSVALQAYHLRQAMIEFEGKYVRNILVLTAWDYDLSAELLGISRRTLFRKLRRHRLDAVAPNKMIFEGEHPS